ncbi:indolepyruvate oxidoreductase subunit beta [Clostridium thermosuccinogenes]|jgi:indolepyruvate ferredoxin oxidoreductase beta subunit|uniref:Indolepyruvate oxidoreductase subunit beta n=1 Tax=Clostridium thermosuccinogenes TaxID=84032 RepID=A0A2K2F6J2_9CLOT|nr:indolepyruvate oxidoreductase subunit beta [Pseudoclostridium thermosuccinogenes]AUS98728.1 indolepyruvate oxidoreductase subunit beta [Pseudoclostridium thermosuccinogenes]PNT94403.1 indolepyruvate oxidoreductase subunit beta [Pseudoclostridium thermosuccinogenes]PNT95089.1 indolepyruvate oxidoreductase subunit beta [Pseudoclostridium thermosuccinogenes]PNT95836.1 indolepyruvate oxidoreductase subunit beta [Pseudoclostridium thermosuccinogenes]
MQKLNIMIVGVGGQGTLLASKVLGHVAMKESYDVKVSEVHGMSQRGGSVVTYVKLGPKVYSPLVEKGEADIILAFEKLEALRWLEYLKDGGKLIVNDQEIDPMPVIIRKAKYPENILPRIKEKYANTISLDALSIARQCGNIKAVNTVLLGVLAKSTNIAKETWIESIKEVVPAKFVDVNLKAFEAGYAI